MKKVLLIINALIIVTLLKANPIPGPSVELSELYFDTSGNWVIELLYFNENSGIFGTIDSIWIKTSSGISSIKSFNIVGLTGLIIVRNDSLFSNLSINPNEDSIEISYMLKGSYKISNNPLIYGNLINSITNSPKKGQSIARTPNNGLFSIDNSPTIGIVNDTIGMCGIITGHIYDLNNKLLTNSSISMSGNDGFYLNIKSDGTYTLNSYSYRTKLYYLYYHYSHGCFIKIAPLNITMMPDSVVSIDIHLLDDLNKVHIEEINGIGKSLFRIFPNPINELIFNYETEIPVRSTNSYIEIINLQGQIIAHFSITENIGKIELPSSIINGMYAILLFVNNKNYCSSKVLIAR